MDPAMFDNYHHVLIKGEPVQESQPNLISPSVSPSPSASLTLPVSRRKCSIVSSVAGPKRARPYPSSTNRINSRKEDLNMSTGYESWTHGARSSHGTRSHPSAERRSLDGENSNAYAHGSYMHDSYGMGSSSTLTGAIGMASDANNHHSSRQSRSPASSHSGSVYTGTLSQNHDMAWNAQLQQTNMMISSNSTYPGVAGHGGLQYSNMTMNDTFPMTTTRNVSPKSLSSPSPPSYGSQAQANGMIFPGSSMNHHYTSTSSSHEGQSDKEVIRQLQQRVRQLEEQCQQQQQQHAKAGAFGGQGAASGLPNPPVSAAFQRQWKARTEARTRIFCSLNRAGNALCSWHDSRRERRQFPPRNAPPGYLNCGCTFEEALFEESLARHRVGSYHPGDSVRMDPALRNPLLKLLVARYGYKDGDFDHDPLTETWNEGEDPLSWEQKAHSGAHMRRRNENAH